MPKVDRGVSRLFDNIFGRVLQTIYHERTSKFDRVLGGLQLSSPKLAPSSSYSALAPLYQGSGTLFFKTIIHWRQTTVNDNMLVWSLLASMVLWLL